MHNSKVLNFLLLILPFAFLLLPLKASAQGTSLGVYPPIFQIDATAPANIQAPLSIQNPGDTPLSLSVSLRPFKASDQEDGQIKHISEDEANFADPFILQRIQILENGTPITNVSLSPKQKKELVLSIQLPKDEPPGDYYFSILFIGSPTNSSEINSSQTVAGIASNVLLSVGPKAKIEATIQEFSGPAFVNEGPTQLTVRIKNKNDFFITPFGDIIIKNIFGQTVGRIDLPKTNILAKTVRGFPAKWEEKYPLGIYKASLTLSMSEEGPVVKRDIFFLALPTNALLVAILLFFVLSYITIRVKSKI